MNRRLTWLGVCGAVIALVVSGCSPVAGPAPTPTSNPVPKPTLSAGFVNRLDGSTATIPLASATLKALTGTDKGMEFNKTNQAYVNLINGDKDLILVTYPSTEELQMAKDAGVELEVVPVVKDALVFLANTANPVTGLTHDQVKQIYTGKITDWSEIGGTPGAIIPYQRPVNSGSQTLFLKLAMSDKKPMDAPKSLRPGEMSALIDVIANYDNSPQALGFSVFYYATQMYLKDTVKLLAIDGVMPSAATVSDGSYAYCTNYYAVLRKDTPADDEARQVLKWMLGDEGQQIASRNNYVPLEARNISAPEPEYGYFGSTAANTTQSSGTGGTSQKAVDQLPSSQVHCTNGVPDSIVIDGAPAMTQAIRQWYAAHGGMEYCSSSYITADIATVYSSPMVDGTYQSYYGAVLASGQSVRLSDLFYDGVNYIDFINHNLLNEGTNPLYADWLNASDRYPFEGVQPVDPPHGFTGIPNDYADFTISLDSAGLTLNVHFPDGNPFFATVPVSQDPADAGKGSSEATIGLVLPADLSPYGRIWREQWTTLPSGQLTQLITTTSTPSDSDAKLNRQIAAVAAAHPNFACLWPVAGPGRLAVLGYTSQGPCLAPSEKIGMPQVVAQWALGTWVDDRMTVADLPSNWRTGPWGGPSLAGPLVCPVNRPDDHSCQAVEEGTVLSDQAQVRGVWVSSWGLCADIIDGGKQYSLEFDV